MCLANLNLIPKFNLVKKSKCHVYVESKQTRKPHKAAELRNLAPLELIHSDLCEMNGILKSLSAMCVLNQNKLANLVRLLS